MTLSATIGSQGDTLSFVSLETIIGIPGEQGEAWRAHSTAHETLKFAVKIGRTPLDSEPMRKGYAVFKAEFQTLAALNHPNIVKVFHFGEFNRAGKDYPFYIMEYLGDDVNTLGSILSLDPEFSVLICLKAFFDTADALRYLHLKKRGFHSDIKASNILVAQQEIHDFRIKLIDFGFARLLRDPSDEGDSTKSGNAPTKISSVTRPTLARTEQHRDVWQLCFIIKGALDKCFKPPHDTYMMELWPIDNSDYLRFYTLLDAWGSTNAGSLAETGDINDFYDSVNILHRRLIPDVMDPNFRGAIRYLSVREIGTVAKCRVASHSIRIPPRRIALYTERIARILAADEMTRLGNTRQLGFTHLVYPGAQGTRLEHAIGVFELACNFIVRMSSYSAFRSVCPDPKDSLLFVVAALLHDVGHFPFAHQLEEFSKEDFSEEQWAKVHSIIEGKHEGRSCAIVEGSLAPLLMRTFDFSKEDIRRLSLMIAELKSNSPDGLVAGKDPSLSFFRTIINGPVDIDKLDYIERDAYHCGVPYGSNVDVERIFETMRIVADEGGISAHMAFDQRGVGCIEQLVTARHQLYANVYWHRAVRSATAMFKHLFYLFQEVAGDRKEVEMPFLESGSDQGCLYHIEEYAERHARDGIVKNAMMALSQVVSGKKRSLFKAIVQRDHEDRLIKSYGEHMYPQQRKKAREIYEMLKKRGFWVNGPENIGEHNVLIDCRSDSWPDFNKIQIIDTMGDEHPIGKFAATVKDLGDSFTKQACRIRVFVNVGALNEQYQNKVGRRNIEEAIIEMLE